MDRKDAHPAMHLKTSTHLCELRWRQEMAMSIFKLALQMLPAWFFSLIWHTQLFYIFPWSERNGQPISCIYSKCFYTHKMHIQIWCSQLPCRFTRASSSTAWWQPAAAGAGWAQPQPQGSRLPGNFSLTYLRSDKHNSHMLRDCAYSLISQLVTTAKYSTSSFPQNKTHNRPFRHLSLKSFWRVARANG